MLSLPLEGSDVILAFRSLFTKKVFEHVKVLLMGALLSVGRHTVCAALCFAGLGHTPHFQNYHRLLNRVKWSALRASHLLLQLLVSSFTANEEPLVFAINKTIERRRGTSIKAKGIYRYPVGASHSYFVKCSGLRWISLMLPVQSELGRAGMGTTFSDGTGTLRTLL